MSNAALNARSDAISNAPEEPAIPESGASAVSWGRLLRERSSHRLYLLRY